MGSEAFSDFLMLTPICFITASMGKSIYLDQTIRSVLARYNSGDRYVLVGPDALRAQIARFEDVRLEYIPEAGRGLYAAINQVLSLCDHPQFTYINDDDLLDYGFASLRLRTPVSSVGYGRVVYINASGAEIFAMPYSRSCKSLKVGGMGIPPYTQQGSIYPTEFVKRTGCFAVEYSLCADFEMILRFLAAGVNHVHIDAKVAGFRVHGGQLSQNTRAIEAQVSSIVAKSRVKGSTIGRLLFLIENRDIYLSRIGRGRFGSTRTLFERGGK